MVGIMQVLFRHGLEQFQFHLEWGFPLGHSGPVCQPEDVGVNCDGRFTKGRVQYNIGCFSPDTRQGLQ